MSSRSVPILGALAPLWLSFPVHAELPTNRVELKSMIIRSMTGNEGGQSASLGPMRDGRRVEAFFEYLQDGGGLRTTELGRNRYCITFDRSAVAISALAADAFIVCQEHGSCERIPAYLDELREARSVAALPLIEEFEPNLAPGLARWSRTSRYARAWLDLHHSFLIAFQLHELAHIALHHLPSLTLDERVKSEGEADGFAIFTATLADRDVSGGATLVLGSPTERGSFTACRAEAYATDLAGYMKRHHPDWRPPVVFPRWSGKSHFSSGFRLGDMTTEWPRPEECRAYSQAVKTGVAAAMHLIDTNVPIASQTHKGQNCQR